MGNLLTIRLPDNEKEALELSSRLSEMPVSKVILPFISEGVKTSLGALLIQRIDRAYVYGRRNHEQFINIIMGPASSPSTGGSGVMADSLHGRIPGSSGIILTCWRKPAR